MWLWLSLLIAVGTAVIPCSAQEPPELTDIAAHAGIIFRGTVVSVVYEAPLTPGEIPVVRVTFRVEDGIRQTTAGQTLTLRQWRTAASEYRLGETLVLFLYPTSDATGLTSAVGGTAGHRRVEDLSPGFLDGLRTARMPAAGATAQPGASPQRPVRGARGSMR